jgi:sigma-B regulation protein RsbU (phosphoserine phosphatase)
MLLAAAVLMPVAQAQNNAGIFHLDTNREPLVSLDSGWRFHPGDDPRWAKADFDDSTWPMLRADKPWSSQGYPGLSGFGWYRFTLEIPAEHLPVAIELAPIMTSYQLYIEGQPVRNVGSAAGSIIPSAVWDYQIFPLPSAALDAKPRTVHVALRVWHSPIWASYMGGGPESSGNLFGSLNLLQAEQKHHAGRRRLLFVDLFTYSVTAFIIAITIFGLFAFRPKEREYLWFGLVILAKAIDAVLNISKEIYAVPSIPIYDLLDGICVAGAQIALLLFLARVLNLRRNWIWLTVAVLAAISPIFGIMYWPGWLLVPIAAFLQILLLLPSSIWMLTVLATRAVRGNGTARLLIFPVFLAQGFWLADNFVISLAQFGLPIEARYLETPFRLAPYEIHPAVLAELLFLLAMLAFLIQRFTVARRREERYESELEAARQVQQVVLPAQIEQIPRFDIECIYLPSERVGGDFYQIIPTAAGGLLVVTGDVAGKGLPAALMVSMLVGAVCAEAVHTSDPAALLAALNESSCGHTHGKFTTCLCLHIDADGNVKAANAGHLNPYLNGIEIAMEPALPLGLVRQESYMTTRFAMSVGERLTIVSDGVLEARSDRGELFGFERTCAISTKLATEIAAAARDFGQDDDITVLTIAYLGATDANSKTTSTIGPASQSLV